VFVAVQGLLLPPSAPLAGAIAEALGVETAIWLGMGVGVLAPLCLLPLACVPSITEAQVSRPHDGVTL
jgi:hypothetical protein